MNRAWLPGAACMLALVACSPKDPFADPEYARVCAGQPIHSAEERQAAAERGYEIDNTYDCVTRRSFDAVAAIEAASTQARAAHAADAKNPPSDPPRPTLGEARRKFSTRVAVPGNGSPLPTPPAGLFVRGDYASDGRTLAAFVTPDPRDDEKHPAIVWLTGGDTSSLDDFWSEGAPDNDQSASAFRNAGIVMMFPTLRGGNQNAGAHEYFFGEVDDVIAAGNHLAKLAYVDPGKVYLGGHSTGGTLALLVSETTSRFAAVFAFGAVSDAGRYPVSLVPVDYSGLARAELELRSPIHWLAGISSPTWLIEGEDSPGNLGELERLCTRPVSQLHCIPVPGHNHFSVLSTATRRIAARIFVAADGREIALEARDFTAH